MDPCKDTTYEKSKQIAACCNQESEGSLPTYPLTVLCAYVGNTHLY